MFEQQTRDLGHRRLRESSPNDGLLWLPPTTRAI